MPYTMGLIESIPTVEKRGGRLSAIKGVVPSPFHLPPACRFEPRCPYRWETCREVPPELYPVGASGRDRPLPPAPRARPTRRREAAIAQHEQNMTHGPPATARPPRGTGPHDDRGRGRAPIAEPDRPPQAPAPPAARASATAARCCSASPATAITGLFIAVAGGDHRDQGRARRCSSRSRWSSIPLPRCSTASAADADPPDLVTGVAVGVGLLLAGHLPVPHRHDESRTSDANAIFFLQLLSPRPRVRRRPRRGTSPGAAPGSTASEKPAARRGVGRPPDHGAAHRRARPRRRRRRSSARTRARRLRAPPRRLRHRRSSWSAILTAIPIALGVGLRSALGGGHRLAGRHRRGRRAASLVNLGYFAVLLDATAA